jgi:hypothetical protein
LLHAKGTCPCGHRVQATEALVLCSTDSEDPLLTLIDKRSRLTCKKCRKKICAGCYTEAVDPGQCCAAVRAILLFELLAAVDELNYEPVKAFKQAAAAPVQPPTKRSRYSNAAPKANGTGYGAGGYGADKYAAAYDHYGIYSASGAYGVAPALQQSTAGSIAVQAKEAQQGAKDAKLSKLFSAVADVLPQPARLIPVPLSKLIVHRTTTMPKSTTGSHTS